MDASFRIFGNRAPAPPRKDEVNSTTAQDPHGEIGSALESDMVSGHLQRTSLAMQSVVNQSSHAECGEPV